MIPNFPFLELEPLPQTYFYLPTGHLLWILNMHPKFTYLNQSHPSPLFLIFLITVKTTLLYLVAQINKLGVMLDAPTSLTHHYLNH